MTKILISEDTFAASTLNPRSMAYDPDHTSDVEELIAQYNSLNTKAKQRVLGMVQSMMADAGTGKGTFGPSLHASYKNGADWPTVAEWLSDGLDEQFEECGFTQEFRDKATQLFYEAVEARTNNGPIERAIEDFTNEWGFNPFLTDEEIDVMQLLSNRIRDLEMQIECVQTTNEELIQGLSESLQEETNPSESSCRSPRRKSTVNQYLMEADPDNEDALFNEQQQVRDMTMQRYLDHF